MHLMSVIRMLDRERKRRFAKCLLFDVCICEINRSARQIIDVFTMKKATQELFFLLEFQRFSQMELSIDFFSRKDKFS